LWVQYNYADEKGEFSMIIAVHSIQFYSHSRISGRLDRSGPVLKCASLRSQIAQCESATPSHTPRSERADPRGGAQLTHLMFQ
jgi:hypothetical protein